MNELEKQDQKVKELALKHGVSEDVVRTIMSNAIVLLAMSAELRNNSTEAVFKIEMMVEEYGNRWLVLAPLLDVSREVMSETVSEVTAAATELLDEVSVDALANLSKLI